MGPLEKFFGVQLKSELTGEHQNRYPPDINLAPNHARTSQVRCMIPSPRCHRLPLTSENRRVKHETTRADLIDDDVRYTGVEAVRIGEHLTMRMCEPNAVTGLVAPEWRMNAAAVEAFEVGAYDKCVYWF